ncbi:F-box protein At3g07870-like [Chenopodium quinoa]|uniref:F-box protein At3g07870-like n=1 Tax=Chenopodium quinoa TaxID=63459 RepID=UPI000B796F5A|nr:F-box protein At3g07870-like [Chenopodium quinoa]
MEQTTAKSESETPTLPDDVIVEMILPRLPVKPLIRFKCVSKFWLTTLSSNKFAKTHLNISSLSNTKSLIYKEINCYRRHNGRFLSFDECNNMKEFVNLEDRYNGPRYGPTPRATRIVGSCNGVLCLFDSDLFEFVLWNPVTNHYHLAGGLELNYVPNDDVTSVGFGYISSIDDYKIEARVYRDEKSHIVGLNLVSGLLTKVQLPNLLTRNFDAKVFEIKGSLSLCCTMYDHGRRHTTRVYDVWTLKNNGDGNSWEKSFSINIKGLTLLYIFETGKCLVTRNSNQLMLFDPNEATSSSSTEGDGEVAAIWQRRKRSRGNLSNFYHKAIADVWNYTESLISPCGIFACGE